MKWKIESKNNTPRTFETNREFTEWFDATLLAQYESAEGAMDMARRIEYGTAGYYLGLGYTLFYIEQKSLDQYILESNTPKKCLHPRKYLNIISNNLQFVVCPDCKEEVLESSTPSSNDNHWGWGF